MTFPKFHGIELTEGGHIGNLNLEQLDHDPTNLTDGRLWIDRLDDKLKYASVNEGTGEIKVFTLATEQDTQTTLALLDTGTSLINTQAILLANLK
jgi:hypothetical protein